MGGHSGLAPHKTDGLAPERCGRPFTHVMLIGSSSYFFIAPVLVSLDIFFHISMYQLCHIIPSPFSEAKKEAGETT